MSELLTAEQIDQFKAHIAAIEHPRELIIDLLRTVQENRGWVPDEGIELVAGLLGLTPLEVEEIATFYDKIYRRPVGRYPIHICDSICCWSRGGEQLAKHLQESLDIAPGETSADGLFTLLPTCCLGVCGRAPAMMIGRQSYGPLDNAEVDRILAELRQEAQA
ncbi:MAG: NADH-quinone oxidoreductase subunit NuoE [Desulfuromonadales bacterium]|jgi:NADH-quinone oxidoreductase subunit E|nr:NADH-quinone oxidoreductase subunit NuoE [Desulfuromonadales bacterium]